ncbi:Aspartic proteinase-like protein 1 [Linum perenne]
MAARSPLLLLFLAVLIQEVLGGITLSTKLIHRFSNEVKSLRARRNITATAYWPEKRSQEYYSLLLDSDLQRQKMKLGPRYELLFPAEGSNTLSLGNDFGWLHYTLIDMGTPHVSFLVAVDTGSDLLWVPCECLQCAPLSASYYGSLDQDLKEYSPSQSSSSKLLSCSDPLCELGSKCKSPSQQCPYSVQYYSENTSSSGLLVQDVLYFASDDVGTSNVSLKAPVLVGCGKKQSGGYLNGIAPDGLMGLGPGKISVPSFLARAGFIQDSFSLCFDEEDSGKIYFGDQGPDAQHSTPFLTSNGNYTTYIVGVEACCVGGSCLKQTSFKALVDSGTSFTFLPQAVFQKTADEFHRRVNAPLASFEGYPWKYCYKSSSEDSPKIPSMKLAFEMNNTFMIHSPVFKTYGVQGITGFCLAIQPADGDIGILGLNFMTGYRIVFDRENLKLGWSRSKCEDEIIWVPGNPSGTTPSSGNPLLPTNEEQRIPGQHAVSPAIAGRAPLQPSAAASSTKQASSHLSSAVNLLPVLKPDPVSQSRVENCLEGPTMAGAEVEEEKLRTFLQWLQVNKVELRSCEIKYSGRNKGFGLFSSVDVSDDGKITRISEFQKGNCKLFSDSLVVDQDSTETVVDQDSTKFENECFLVVLAGVLLVVPLDLAITPMRVLQDPLIGPDCRAMLEEGEVDDRYLDMLPTTFGNPLWFSDCDLLELKGTALHRASELQKKSLMSLFEDKAKDLVRKLLILDGSTKTANSVFWTRALNIPFPRSYVFPTFQEGDGGCLSNDTVTCEESKLPVSEGQANGLPSTSSQDETVWVEGLVPGIDFCNHDLRAMATWEVDGTGSKTGTPCSMYLLSVDLSFSRNWKAERSLFDVGKEISISYGSKGNEVHYPIEALQSAPFSEAKLQLLQAQKAELRHLLPKSLLNKGFFPASSTTSLRNGETDKAEVTKVSNFSWSGQRKTPCYIDKLVFPDDFLAALRTIAMREDELFKVSSLLQEVLMRKDSLHQVK